MRSVRLTGSGTVGSAVGLAMTGRVAAQVLLCGLVGMACLALLSTGDLPLLGLLVLWDACCVSYDAFTVCLVVATATCLA